MATMETFFSSRLRIVVTLVTLIATVFTAGMAIGGDRDQIRQLKQSVGLVEKRQDIADRDLKDVVKDLNQSVLRLTEVVARLEGRITVNEDRRK